MLWVIRAYPTETKLFLVLSLLFIALSLTSDSFFTLGNLTSLLNNNAVNVIWAVGLLVVLIAGGIDISFAVGASVVQYLCVYTFAAIGGGNWAVGLAFGALFGIRLGLINSYLIHQFRIISIVVTISTFNVFFGLLMFFSSDRFLYNLPRWWSRRVVLWEHQSADGSLADLTLPVAVMFAAMLATWFLIRHTTTGRSSTPLATTPKARAGPGSTSH